jgi:hypothetical protein
LAVKKRRILSLKFPPGGSANSIECFAVWRIGRRNRRGKKRPSS